MDDRHALMAAIIANPDEDTPRLVFADWLQEHGDKHEQARAEFIRLQCELAKLPEKPVTANHRRAKALHKKHFKAWMGPLSQSTSMWDFSRGLLENWYCTATEFAKKSHEKEICEWLPRLGVSSVLITRPTTRVRAIADSPALAWVSELCWLYTKLDDAGMQAVAETLHGSQLSRLLLSELSCTNVGLRALAKSAAFPNLRELGLRASSRRTEYTHTGMIRILESEHFPELDSLDMLDGLPGGFQETPLYKHAGLSRLRKFWPPSGSSVGKIARCPHFTRLESLRICETRISDDDVLALLDNPSLAKLKALSFASVKPVRDPLSPAVEKRLRDRFGSGLGLYDSPAFRQK
ncbi:MAG: hypothetical protein C0467_13850 [Planctomycetaceae bacterium]|nr:hypothetical protein [Planctomycetaceae bacterium]